MSIFAHIRSTLLWLLTLTMPFAASAKLTTAQRANAERVGIEVMAISVVGTDMIIDLRIQATGLEISTRHQMMVEPVLRGHGGEMLAMPSVVYAGAQRYLFDRRAQIIHPASGYLTPFRTFMGVNPRRTYTVDYSVSVPYQLWMGTGSLSVFYRLHDCCDELMVSDELLVEDLGLQYCDCPTELPTASDLIFEPEVDPNYDPAQWYPDMSLIAPMVLFVTPQVEAVKMRREHYTTYINFQQDRSNIIPDYKNNAEELRRIYELVNSIADDPGTTLQQIRIDGYASPEGNWQHNVDLSMRRAMALRDHVKQAFGLGDERFDIAGHGEDWVGFEKLVEASDMPGREEVLHIIRTVDIFAGREAQLMELGGGATYKYMLREMFPKLRRMELSADYVVGEIAETDLEAVFAPHPERLSLEEMHRLAQRYPIGSEPFARIYRTAAHYFPHDVVAVNNAAAVALLAGDAREAVMLLDKINGNPHSFVNKGVASYILEGPEAAKAWFERAAAAGFETGLNNISILER